MCFFIVVAASIIVIDNDLVLFGADFKIPADDMSKTVGHLITQ